MHPEDTGSAHGSLAYREQAYVERCMCDAAAVGPCASCGRARCAAHLARGLCDRCNQAIGGEIDARSGGRFTMSAVTGTGITLGALALHTAAGLVLALPLALAMFFALRWRQRRRLIRRLGPALAASKGELTAARDADDSSFPEAPPVNRYISSGSL